MPRPAFVLTGLLLAILAAAVATIAVVRHRGRAMGRSVPGGILMDRPAAYDRLSRILMRPLFRGIAADVAAATPAGGRVLEVGCGPGHLAIMLAHRGLEVTGIDLDPAMIQRAVANATRADGALRPSFLVGSAAALPVPDASVDVVVSTFSIHHWEEPAMGLAEIGRVLRPGGRALIWDFKPGGGPHLLGPRHEDLPDPLELVRGTLLRPVGATPWRWPWRFELAQRSELLRGAGPSP